MGTFPRIHLVVLAVTALGLASASSASALLPDLSLLASESFPWTAEGTAAGAYNVTTLIGSSFICTGLTIKVEFVQLGSLGIYRLTFTGCKEGATNKCKTGAEPAETVVITGEAHLVFISLSPLTVGVLYLVPTTTLLCGPAGSPEKLKIKIEGSSLARFTGALNTNLTMYTTVIHGSKGKAENAKYLNSEGKEVEASLKANFGLGSEGADMNSEKELEDKGAAMFIING
ncbi:MAG TPA: hypothetical protein VHW67_07010 [Solirubrobacteraceae bacterium]|jgi:hypothetical protein|nr:hypothetical protein [Solirubrobacteraceae bacterium]